MMEPYQVTRQRLEQRLNDLTRRLQKVEGDRRRARNPLEPDWEEQAITRQNDEVLDGLDVADHREVTMAPACLVTARLH